MRNHRAALTLEVLFHHHSLIRSENQPINVYLSDPCTPVAVLSSPESCVQLFSCSSHYHSGESFCSESNSVMCALHFPKLMFYTGKIKEVVRQKPRVPPGDVKGYYSSDTSTFQRCILLLVMFLMHGIDRRNYLPIFPPLSITLFLGLGRSAAGNIRQLRQEDGGGREIQNHSLLRV